MAAGSLAARTTRGGRRKRAWRVRAGGACDGAYDTAVFLADALLPGREPFSESAHDRWRVLADELGEAPDAYSRDVYDALPRGATSGWTAGVAHPVDIRESFFPPAIREAGLGPDEEWTSLETSGPVTEAAAAFSRYPSWFYEGLCYRDYAIDPAGIRPGPGAD